MSTVLIKLGYCKLRNSYNIASMSTSLFYFLAMTVQHKQRSICSVFFLNHQKCILIMAWNKEHG